MTRGLSKCSTRPLLALRVEAAVAALAVDRERDLLDGDSESVGFAESVKHLTIGWDYSAGARSEVMRTKSTPLRRVLTLLRWGTIVISIAALAALLGADALAGAIEQGLQQSVDRTPTTYSAASATEEGQGIPK